MKPFETITLVMERRMRVGIKEVTKIIEYKIPERNRMLIGMMHASILMVGSGSENFPSLCEK
jgi:hypothetical protein